MHATIEEFAAKGYRHIECFSARAARLESVYKRLVCVSEKNVMKTFISLFAVTLALAFTVPALGGEKAKESRLNARRMAARGMRRPSTAQENIEAPIATSPWRKSTGPCSPGSAISKAASCSSTASMVAEGTDNAICHIACNTTKLEVLGANDPNRPFRTSECQLRYNTPAMAPLRRLEPPLRQLGA